MMNEGKTMRDDLEEAWNAKAFGGLVNQLRAYACEPIARQAADKIERYEKVLREIAEFCSTDASTLGAIERLVHIRNTADQALK